MNLVKENVSFYMPALIEIIGNNDFDWEHIDELFSKKIAERTSKFNEQIIKEDSFAKYDEKATIVSATVYDMIIEVKKGNRQAIGLLDFFHKMLTELSTRLIDKEKKLIKNTLREVLTNLDYKYLNFIGELATLNNLIKSNGYRLEKCELKLSNDKSIDFVLRNVKNNKLVLVEILNIHADVEYIEDDAEKIKTFISKRVEDKIKDKTKKLVDNVDFFIVPVIWSGWEGLKIYSEYFKKNEMHIPNVIEPLAYLTFTDPKDVLYYLHRFGRVSNLFRSDDDIVK